MNIEDLTKINTRFIYAHYEITPSDEQTANKWIKLIEQSRDKTTPKAGDIVQLTTKHGDYYGFAHIDIIKDGAASVCEQAYVPFIGSYNEKTKDFTFSTSGGAWTSCDIKKFRYIGTSKKRFTDWGHCGACADGAVDFLATVNVWDYIEDGALYGEYSTKDYKKEYITFLTPEAQERRQTNYKILSDRFNAWETLQEYNDYKKIFNGVDFEQSGFNGVKNKILFTYKVNNFYNTSAFMYDSLNLKKYIILNNGSKYIVKVARDDEQKQVFLYFCNDYKIKFTTIETWKKYKLYSEYTED